MNLRRLIIGLVISTAALLLAVLVPAATPAWGGAPTITVTPDVAAPGSVVTISGQSSEIGGGGCEVTVDGITAEADCSYDSSGAVTASLRLSGDLQPGSVTVGVCLPICGEPDGPVWSASAVLVVGSIVPGVLGQQFGDAAAVIDKAGLTAVLAAGSAEDGTVVSQDPAGDSVAAPGAQVALVLKGTSVSPEQIPVPDLVGKTLDEATAAVADLPLTLRGDGVGSDVVTGQDPSPPQTLPPDGVITVQLAPTRNGLGTVAVPGVVGDDVDVARAELAAVGLDLGINGSNGQGKVTTQNPAQGDDVAPNTTVFVTLAAVDVPPTETPTSTVSSPPISQSPTTASGPTGTESSTATAGDRTGTDSRTATAGGATGTDSGTATASPTSTAGETVTVPDVTNLSLTDAQAALAAAGLGIDEPEGSGPTAKVSAQDPGAGVVVPRGTVVTIELSPGGVAPVSSDSSPWAVLLTILAGLAGLAAGAVAIHFLRKRPHGPRWMSRHVRVVANRGSVVHGSEPELITSDDHAHCYELVGHRHEYSVTLEEDPS